MNAMNEQAAQRVAQQAARRSKSLDGALAAIEAQRVTERRGMFPRDVDAIAVRAIALLDGYEWTTGYGKARS